MYNDLLRLTNKKQKKETKMPSLAYELAPTTDSEILALDELIV
jgi:hypothetical protein